MIKVIDAYEGTTHLLNVSQIQEIQGPFYYQHKAAIRLIGSQSWIKTRETIDEIDARSRGTALTAT
jgi:hypothetical protein